MGSVLTGRSLPRRQAERCELQLACAIVLCGITLFGGFASAQSGPPPAAVEAPNAGNPARNSNDAHASWTESLGEPTVYVEHARADVGSGRYQSAARNLRKAAAILAKKSKSAYSLDRSRLGEDVGALRLTARDVAAGAITSPAQLDTVLDATHADLREHANATR
jgi:hypothetical protein